LPSKDLLSQTQWCIRHYYSEESVYVQIKFLIPLKPQTMSETVHCVLHASRQSCRDSRHGSRPTSESPYTAICAPCSLSCQRCFASHVSV
jgi:hypothetical protein